jgi:hypothetical protein
VILIESWGTKNPYLSSFAESTAHSNMEDYL